ncbi:MAG: polysaccharide deacetylase family protein [Patescibacteria group bacterium]
MKKNKRIIFSILAIIVIFIVAIFTTINLNQRLQKDNKKPINAMLMLIEFEKINGILRWEKELDNRKLTALVKVQDNVLKEYPEVFKRLANKGYEIAGGYDEASFWDMPYDQQYEHIKESKELVEKITGKTMRVFGSRYFAYDENTLKAANALGIEYILGRGVNDVEAVIYQPIEYKTKIISVTNVDVGEMGRGSLCDYSLWARGSNAKDFGTILTESIAKNPMNMILVSHAYLGGTRLEWWQEYEKALKSDRIKWASFNNWLENQKVVTMANAKIPLNKEVKYVSPKPAKEIQDYEPIPGVETIRNTTTSEDLMICQ